MRGSPSPSKTGPTFKACLAHTYSKPKRVCPHFPSGLERAVATVACFIKADCQKTNWLQTDKIFSFICNKLRCEVHSSPFLRGVASFKRLKTEHPLIGCQVRPSYQDVTISQGCPAPFKFVETFFIYIITSRVASFAKVHHLRNELLQCQCLCWFHVC